MDADAHTSVHTASPSASAFAYEELKMLLLLGDVPIGVRLREERLAERLKVSRTPVHEALLRLHFENFVERHPEGGYRATFPNAQTMRELYEVRRALELFALRLPSEETRDRRALEGLYEEWASIDVDSPPDADFVLLDEDFHRRLAESAGNFQLAEELRRLNERIRPVRTHDFVTPARIPATVGEHLAILEALLAQRTAAAADLLDRHITASQAVVELAVANMLERMLSVGERDSW